LAQIPEFKSAAATFLKRLSADLTEVFCHKGKVLFKEGTPLNDLYFVQNKGVFRIEKNVAIPVEEVDKPLVVECESWESPLVANCKSEWKEKIKRRARALSKTLASGAKYQVDKKTE